MAEEWRIVGDFLDFCKCRVPCPCSWGRPPDEDDCQGVIAYRFREGSHYGDVDLSGLNVVGVSRFEGNIWDEDVRADIGMIVDERADEPQREAIQTIFGGEVGSWPQMFAENVLGEMLGLEFGPVELEIADDSSSWSLKVPGKVTGSAEVLIGPTNRPGEQAHVVNIPGSEAGPNSGPMTYGIASSNEVDAFGFKWDWGGRSAKHIPFEWSSDDQY
jgi:hypothetical protein